MTKDSGSEEIEVWIGNPGRIVMGTAVGGFDDGDEVEMHAKVIGKAVDAIRANTQEFIESWKTAFNAIEAVFATDQGPGMSSAFMLDSVTAKLSLTASGKVVFIGELGGEIAFEAQFKRRT
jgi:hypothetical protein